MGVRLNQKLNIDYQIGRIHSEFYSTKKKQSETPKTERESALSRCLFSPGKPFSLFLLTITITL